MNLRIKELQKLIKKMKLDALLIENPIDLYYLTGMSLSLGSLIADAKGVELFVDGRYLQACKDKLKIAVSLSSNEKILAYLLEKKVKVLGFDSEVTTVARFEKLKILQDNAKKKGLFLKLEAVSSPILSLRIVKDKEEQKLLKKSADLLWKGYQHIKKIATSGMTEKEVAQEFEIFCKKNGAERLAFDPIIAFGKNSAFPHHRASDTKIKADGILLIDIGVVVGRYHSDMTRVIFLGKGHKRLKEMYELVKRAQKKALSLCRPNVKVCDLDKAAREVFAKEGLEKYFVHNLGHGVGLEIHEAPRLKGKGEGKDLKLKSGMVITFEPGLYFPGTGGVRYEDTVIVTDGGYENLYKDES